MHVHILGDRSFVQAKCKKFRQFIEWAKGRRCVLLTCCNVALSGGMSMVSSSVTAHNVMAKQHPDLAELLHQPYYCSRQAEEAPDEAPYYPNPIYDEAAGVLCSKWNRNRIRSAQAMEGVPSLTAQQHEALDLLDEILRRPRARQSFEPAEHAEDVAFLVRRVNV